MDPEAKPLEGTQDYIDGYDAGRAAMEKDIIALRSKQLEDYAEIARLREENGWLAHCYREKLEPCEECEHQDCIVARAALEGE